MGSPDCACLSSRFPGILDRVQREISGKAHLRQGYESMLARTADNHPNGAASVHVRILETLGSGKPNCRAGEFNYLSFDETAKLAQDLIFAPGNPKFDRVPHLSQLGTVGQLEFLIEGYRAGLCLNCPALIKEASKDGRAGKTAQWKLRVLLSLFDRRGEPVPLGLREWSALSRLGKPPPGDGGRPSANWYRDRRIIHAVAAISYITGKSPTRSDRITKKKPQSGCDTVARAFQLERYHGYTYDTVRSVWYGTKRSDDGKPTGPTMLKSWRAEDGTSS